MLSSSERFPYFCHTCSRETFPVEHNNEPCCTFCKLPYIEEINSYRSDNNINISQPFRTNTQASQQDNGNISNFFQGEERNISSTNIQANSRRPNSAENGVLRPSSSRGQQGLANTTLFLNFSQNGNQNGLRYLITSPVNASTFSRGNNLWNGNSILNLIFSGASNSLSGFLQQHQAGDHQFENLLNIIMQNDSNRYGSPPASQKSISKLKTQEINDENKENYLNQECSVCKENYKIGDKVHIMPCEHNFHQDCLLPWLKEHNSCPVCRYELSTDDPEYENRKNELRRTISEEGGFQNHDQRRNSSAEPHTNRRRIHNISSIRPPTANRNNISNNQNYNNQVNHINMG